MKYEQFLKSIVNKIITIFVFKYKLKTEFGISFWRMKYYIICIQRKFQNMKKTHFLEKVPYKI